MLSPAVPRFLVLKSGKSFYKTEVGQASRFAINGPGGWLIWKALVKGKDAFLPAQREGHISSGPFKGDRHPEGGRNKQAEQYFPPCYLGKEGPEGKEGGQNLAGGN